MFSGSPPCPDCPYGRVRSNLSDRMADAWASREDVKWARQRDGRGWFLLCQQCHFCEWLGDRRSNNASSRGVVAEPKADSRWTNVLVDGDGLRGEALPRARARQRRSRSPPLQIEFARDSVSRSSSSAVASLPAGLLRGRRGPGEEAHGRWYWGGVWPVWAGSVGGVWDRLGRLRMPPKATATVTSIASTRRGSRQSYSNSHNGRNGSRYSCDSHPPQPQPQQTSCHSRHSNSHGRHSLATDTAD